MKAFITWGNTYKIARAISVSTCTQKFAEPAALAIYHLTHAKRNRQVADVVIREFHQHGM